jgi:hypothetical protein
MHVAACMVDTHAGYLHLCWKNVHHTHRFFHQVTRASAYPATHPAAIHSLIHLPLHLLKTKQASASLPLAHPQHNKSKACHSPTHSTTSQRLATRPPTAQQVKGWHSTNALRPLHDPSVPCLATHTCNSPRIHSAMPPQSCTLLFMRMPSRIRSLLAPLNQHAQAYPPPPPSPPHTAACNPSAHTPTPHAAFAAEYGLARVGASGAGAWVDAERATAAAMKSVRDALRLGDCDAAELASCPKASTTPVSPHADVNSAATLVSNADRLLQRTNNTRQHKPQPQPQLAAASTNFKKADNGRSKGDLVVVYVAPNGSDTAAGTEAAPLRTLAAARDLMRNKRGAVKTNGSVRPGGFVVQRPSRASVYSPPT